MRCDVCKTELDREANTGAVLGWDRDGLRLCDGCNTFTDAELDEFFQTDGQEADQRLIES